MEKTKQTQQMQKDDQPTSREGHRRTQQRRRRCAPPLTSYVIVLLCCILQHSTAFVPSRELSTRGSCARSLADSDECRASDVIVERRRFVESAAVATLATTVPLVKAASATDPVSTAEGLPRITQKVFIDVRISRADGTFYVKPENEVRPDDEPFYGQLVVGLFGEQVPNHCKEFVSYIDVPYQVDSPLPSYSRSKFQTLDSSTGLLVGGTIPGLSVNVIAGGQVLEYSGRVLPAKLWLEDRSSSEPNQKTSHTRKGLLTHRDLDLTPSFGITTRSDSTILDSDHTVFGIVLEDSGLLEKVVDLPVLTDGGTVSKTTDELGVSPGGSVASSVFTAQRRVFRDAAKTFGDTRLDKVYDGKLLRRIEVTKVGLL